VHKSTTRSLIKVILEGCEITLSAVRAVGARRLLVLLKPVPCIRAHGVHPADRLLPLDLGGVDERAPVVDAPPRDTGDENPIFRDAAVPIDSVSDTLKAHADEKRAAASAAMHRLYKRMNTNLDEVVKLGKRLLDHPTLLCRVPTGHAETVDRIKQSAQHGNVQGKGGHANFEIAGVADNWWHFLYAVSFIKLQDSCHDINNSCVSGHVLGAYASDAC